MPKKIKVYIGRCDSLPYYYRSEKYYENVRHGDIFASKKEAKKCYQEVWEAEIIIKNKI